MVLINNLKGLLCLLKLFSKWLLEKNKIVSPKKNPEKDDVDLVLEGLSEIIETIHEKDVAEIVLEDISLEDDTENSLETLEIIKKDLFDGYLGELNETPNPLEYGENATYRNLREGIVYKKGPDNLWEVFVKDGEPGKQGQSAPGGGCGVSEVKNIVENRLAEPIVGTYPGSPSNPFPTEVERNAWAVANASKLYLGYQAYLTGGVETLWIGPDPDDWYEVQYIPHLVTREAAVVRISGDGTAEPALGNLVNANMKVPYYGENVNIIDREYYYIDLNHDYVDGTDLTPHIHLVPINTLGGNVKFSLYYQIHNGGEVVQTPILLTGIVDIGVVAWTEKRIDFTIPGTGLTKNGRVMMHIFRDRNDVQDTYEAAVGVTSVSTHYWANPAQVGHF